MVVNVIRMLKSEFLPLIMEKWTATAEPNESHLLSNWFFFF